MKDSVKTSVSYSKVPTAEAQPVVEQFSIGPHDVTIVVDENTNKNNANRGPSINLAASQNALLQSRKPVQLAFCPNCSKEDVRTRTRTYPSFVTWTLAFVTGVVFFPVFWVPLVVDGAKQTDHYCQNCGVKVGRVKPFQA